MAALVAIVLVVLVLTFGLVLGAPWLVIVPIGLVLVAATWFLALMFSGRTVAEAIRSTRTRRLLGPGGPDDPERRAG